MTALEKHDARLASQRLEKRHARKVRSLIRKIAEQGLAEVVRMQARPGDPGYDGSSDVEWKQHTARQELGKEVYKQVMANSREATRGAVALGVVMVQERMKAADWERKAKELDQPAIDVDAEVVP